MIATVLTAVLAPPAMAVPALLAYAAQTPGIATVSAAADAITVRGSTGDTPAESIAIYALGGWQRRGDYSGQSPVATVVPGSDGIFSAQFGRFGGDHDLFYDKFITIARSAGSSTVLGPARFVDDVQFLGSNDQSYPAAAGKKGLQVRMTDDAEVLGVQHAAINARLDRLMLKEFALGAIKFSSGGRTFYFDASVVRALDSSVKPLSDNGALVTLILTLHQDSRPNSAWPMLVHPDAEVGRGTVYAFNTVTSEGVVYFTAAMEFLGQRYSRADHEYGRVVGYIVGNEIDAQETWYNMGRKPLAAFLRDYSRALRIAWQAARKAYTNVRVYISLTHYWTQSIKPDDPEYAYKPRDLVGALADLTARNGDFPWAVAYHPYPENAFDPAFWNDETATSDVDTIRITFKNIEVLPRYLAQNRLRYRGQPRRIILSEQGFHSADYTDAPLRLQAAAYAYAYYKLKLTGGIDAFILHRHVDHQREGGLRLGLWMWDPQHTRPAIPADRKPIYEVFNYIDTERSLEVTEFAKPIIGIADWKDVIPNFDPAKLAERPLTHLAPVRLDATLTDERVIADFENGSHGWRPSDNASAVERKVSSAAPSGSYTLKVSFDRDLQHWSYHNRAWRGTDVVFDQPVDAGARPHLSVWMRIPDSADDNFKPGNVFYAKVRVYGQGGQVADSMGRLDPTCGWNRLTVDLSGWQQRFAISRIKVWARGSSGDDWKGAYRIDRVSLAQRRSGSE
jgi:hypothetical protein